MEAERLHEARTINESLFFLHKVIQSLAHRESYISHRDCTLTRVLQNSLGQSL